MNTNTERSEQEKNEVPLKVANFPFKDVSRERGQESGDKQEAFHGDHGSITVLDRMTGFGCRDVETGFRSKDGEFWLASGQFDIRHYADLTLEEAIALIKERANTCVPEGYKNEGGANE